MIQIRALAAMATLFVTLYLADYLPIAGAANTLAQTASVQALAVNGDQSADSKWDSNLVVLASSANIEMQSESPGGTSSSEKKASNQLARKKLIGSWIDKDRGVVWIFQSNGVLETINRSDGQEGVEGWRINDETGELERLQNGSPMYGHTFKFDGEKLLLAGDARIILDRCNLPCGMASMPTQSYSSAAVEFRGIVIEVSHPGSLTASVNAATEAGGSTSYSLAAPPSAKERGSFGRSTQNLAAGESIHAKCTAVGKQNNVVKLQCGAIERIVAHTPQEAASAYINTHMTHCGESYYLEDYMGVTPMGIREYRGLRWVVQSLPTTGADKLNGVTDKILVTLSATANRQHSPYGGTWTEWMPGFSTMFTDPANATGVGTHTQAFEMVHTSVGWKLSGAGFEMSKPQACVQLLAIK